MEDENDPRLEAARLEQLLKSNRERIASREKHEATLTRLIEDLLEGGYFREGEDATLHFPEAGFLGNPWKKPDGSWREGFGKAVALCETTSLVNPPANAERNARYPRGDHFEKALRAAGYLLDVWLDYNDSTTDVDVVNYYIYESPEPTQ